MHRSLSEKLWSIAVWAVVVFFIVNLLAMIGSVVVNSFGTRWFNTWLPAGFTPQWYTMAWDEFHLPDILLVTAEVVGAVVLLSGLIGVPTAYAMARRNFPGKRAVMLLFLLPLLVPPITYGIPMATVLYRVHLAGTIWGVILANLVPTVPFVILIMIPFVEQIDPRVEAAARVFGAGLGRLFTQILVPLLTAGDTGRAAAGAGAHDRDVRAHVPDRGADQPDAGGGAVLRGVRGRRAAWAVDRRDGGGVHGHHAGVAADRAALRQSDPDRDAGEAVKGSLSLRGAQRRGNPHGSAQRDGDCFAPLAMTGEFGAFKRSSSHSPDCPGFKWLRQSSARNAKRSRKLERQAVRRHTDRVIVVQINLTPEQETFVSRP